MKWNDPARASYLEMQEESRRREKAQPDAAKPRGAWRDNVYGGLKGKVSVRAMDVIIWSLVALTVVCIVVGIVLGNGQG